MHKTSSVKEDEALAWQTGVWNTISQVYLREVDPRFQPVVKSVLERSGLSSGQSVLDLGTGTGAVAIAAAVLVGTTGKVVGVDISKQMLDLAQAAAARKALVNVSFREGRAESIPAEEGGFDAVLASLSIMYVIDRQAAAQEIARVLRPAGRFVAAVWSGPERCDIVLFQQTAGRFAPAPPVPGVGPGALADPTEFLVQLGKAGVDAEVQTETLGFDFPDFSTAWEVLAGVTTAGLSPERQEEAKRAVQTAMWPAGKGPRHFRNVTQFIVGQRKR